MKRKGDLDLLSAPELYEYLKKNEKIEYDARNETFLYKVCYDKE